jgi:nitroreductase
MTEILKALKTRRSVRTYTAEPVERNVMEDIIDCARFAPTAMNDQPWEFVVITGKEDLKRIPAILGHAEFIANAAFCVLVLTRETTCAVEDACAATENLLLAAEGYRLGACWVAGNQQPYAPVVADAFGAPPELRLVSIVSFGHPAEAPQVKKRPLAEVLHWERF